MEDVKTGARLVFGTYLIKDGAVLSSQLKHAHCLGLRHVDTALLYENEELVLSHAPEDMRIGTKVHGRLPPGLLIHHVRRLVNRRADVLCSSMCPAPPLWRILLHHPLPLYMWRDLEECVRQGLVEAIGICNVDLKTTQLLLKSAHIKPSFVQCELHACLRELDNIMALISLCAFHGIRFEAHSPLAAGRPLADIAAAQSVDAGAVISDQHLQIAAASMLQWIRVVAPAVDICIKSSDPLHLSTLIHAFTMSRCEPTQDLRAWAMQKQDSRIFQLYPLASDSWLTRTILRQPICGFMTCQQLNTIKGIVPEISSSTVVHVARCLREDKAALDLINDNISSSDDLISLASSPNALTGVSCVLSSKRPDPRLFTLLALEMFGTEHTKEIASSIMPENWDHPDNARNRNSSVVFSLWSKPEIASVIAKLKDLVKFIRRELNPVSPPKPPACSKVDRVAKFWQEQQDNGGIPPLIRDPVPMPVDVPASLAFDPLFCWLDHLKSAPTTNVEFEIGAVLAGGHLDMCKQVVGPAHMGNLCRAVAKASQAGAIRHFLLGNNVAFDEPERVRGAGKVEASQASREDGIERMLDLMRIGNADNHAKDGVGIETWYLAGNCIDGEVMRRIVNALQTNSACRSLWLKRNPLGVVGGAAIGRLIAMDRPIEILDLHNTGLGDAGVLALATAMERHLDQSHENNNSLKHLHLGANGISAIGARSVVKILSRLPYLESLFMDMNHLGNDGVAILSNALTKLPLHRLTLGSNNLSDDGLVQACAIAARIPTLKMFDVGYYLSTLDLGERLNCFTDVSPLIELVKTHPQLQMLKMENCGPNIRNCQNVLKAAQDRTELNHHKITVFGLAFEDQKPVKSLTYFAHSKDELRSIKQPPIVDHIYSIYRNAM